MTPIEVQVELRVKRYIRTNGEPYLAIDTSYEPVLTSTPDIGPFPLASSVGSLNQLIAGGYLGGSLPSAAAPIFKTGGAGVNGWATFDPQPQAGNQWWAATANNTPANLAQFAVDESKTDTFTFVETVGQNATVFPTFHPWVYANPENGTANLPPWPELPLSACQLSPFVDDPSNLYTDLSIPIAFDPFLARTPGELAAYQDIDKRLGLQLCLIKFDGNGGSGGGCC